MMTVRFPDGTSVQYNTARYVEYNYHYHTLREGPPTDGRPAQLVAVVPATAIVELVPACRTYNMVRQSELEGLQKELRAVKRALNKLSKAPR